MTAPGQERRPTRINLLARSVLTSVALLLLALPCVAAAGGYVPQARVIAPFGRFLVTDLPWLMLGTAVAFVLSLLAHRLGGRRYTAAFAGWSLVVLVSLVVVWSQYAALAASHGARYDVLRQAQAAAPVSRGPSERVVFAEVDGQELRADVWRTTKPASGADPARPGVLFIHGGAFTHGELGLRPHLFAFLADAGYTVFDVEYRLAPPPRWQDAPADVLCALGWFQSVAQAYGVDPSRIVVMGDSAGGNLALVAAYGPGYGTGNEGLTPSCDVAPVAPAAVIAMYPAADLAATWADVHERGGEKPFPEIYTGGTPTQVPDRYDAASVQRLIRAGLPPTLLITGANDTLIRVERVRDLANRLRAAGSEVELIEVPFADHAFDGPPNGFGAQLLETVLPTFLARLGS